MHEFEALLFSEPQKLAEKLRIPKSQIDDVLSCHINPECINESSNTAPSKRLESFSTRFKKTTTGIAIAKAIGLKKIREKCHIFNDWINAMENLTIYPYSK